MKVSRIPLLFSAIMLLSVMGSAQLEFRTESPIDFFSSIDMNENNLANVSDPVQGGDAVPLDYVQGRFLERTGDTFAGNLSLNNNFIQDSPSIQSVPTSSLTAYWTFEGEENKKNITKDRSIRNNDGTLENSPERVSGKVGNGLGFNGKNQSVDAEQVATYIEGREEFTISGWFKTNDNNGLILGSGNTSNSANYWLAVKDGELEFRVTNQNGNTKTVDGEISQNKWYHGTAVYGNGKVRVYVNGFESENKSLNGELKKTEQNRLQIGHLDAEGDSQTYLPFDGKIDELRVYNKALTGSEAKTLYQMGVNGRQEISGSWLPRDGGKMRGTINLSENNITGLNKLKIEETSAEIYDSANNLEIIKFERGGDVVIPDGDLDMKSNQLINTDFIESGEGNSLKLRGDVGSGREVILEQSNGSDLLRAKNGGNIEIPRGNISMNSNYINNLSNPEAPQDAATKNYVQKFVGDNNQTIEDDQDLSGINGTKPSGTSVVTQEIEITNGEDAYIKDYYSGTEANSKKDLVTGSGLDGGEDDVLVGPDSDVNITISSTAAGNQLNLNSGSLDVNEGSGSGLNADELDDVQLENINWTDTSMKQDHVDVSNLGPANSNLDMNGNRVQNIISTQPGDAVNQSYVNNQIGSQNLKTVLQKGNTAGNQNINMNGQNINSTGRIGVGTSKPDQNLDVEGTAKVSKSGSSIEMDSNGDVTITLG